MFNPLAALSLLRFLDLLLCESLFSYKSIVLSLYREYWLFIESGNTTPAGGSSSYGSSTFSSDPLLSVGTFPLPLDLVLP